MKRIMIIILVLAIALTGCKNNDDTSTGKVFNGGTDAIVFDFMDDTPPDQVFDQGEYPFQARLEIQNKGEFDVAKEDMKIEISGIYGPEFDNPEMMKNPEEDLKGSYIDSNGNKIPGEKAYVTFDGFNYVGKLESGENPYTIRASICYKYGTKAQTDICILDDLTSFEGNKVCEPNEKKNVEVSSAPVQIQNFQQNVAGGEKVTFSFEVIDKGAGIISQLGSGCSKEVQDKNKVWVLVDTGLAGLTCSGLDETNSGYVTLYSGTRLVQCTQTTTDTTGDFEKKVRIELRYDYEDYKEKEVLVKHMSS